MSSPSESEFSESIAKVEITDSIAGVGNLFPACNLEDAG
jgi:hypothetical protein